MLGGALGAVSRYATSLLIARLAPRHAQSYPLATLTVNIAGTFLLSFLLSLRADPTWTVIISTGFLGAFTTFSTFELESHALLRERRPLLMASYVLGSVLLGYAALLFGRWLAAAM